CLPHLGVFGGAVGGMGILVLHRFRIVPLPFSLRLCFCCFCGRSSPCSCFVFFFFSVRRRPFRVVLVPCLLEARGLEFVSQVRLAWTGSLRLVRVAHRRVVGGTLP